jgi:hypothetical protein
MSIPCPHCAAAIDGWVPLDRVNTAAAARDAAIAAKDAAVAAKDAALTEAKEARKKATLYDALQPAYDSLVAESAGLAEMKKTIADMKAAQVDAAYTTAGITNPRIRKVFEMEFEEQAAADDGEKDLGAYLGKLVALPVADRPPHLAPFLSAPAAAAAASPAAMPAPGTINPSAAAPASRLPAATPAAIPAPVAGRLTQAQVTTILGSPEYKALKPDEKKARLTELQTLSRGATPIV